MPAEDADGNIARRIRLRAGAVLGLLTAAFAVEATATTAVVDAELSARLAALEAEVERLRVPAAARRASERRASVRALVDRSVAALVSPGAFDGGVFVPAPPSEAAADFDGRPRLTSGDGRFELGLSAHVQTRFVAGRLGADPPGADRSEAGFEARRIRLKARGHAFDPRLRFELGGGFDVDGGDFGRTDAFVEWRDDGLAVQAGSFRPGFLREEQTSAKRLPMVERSLVSRLVRQPRRAGVQLALTGEDLRLHAGVLDPFSPGGGDGLRLTARLEHRLAGSWRSLRSETGRPGDAPAAAIGGGIVVDEISGGPDRVQATADLVVLGDGWSASVVAVLDDPEAAERGWGATVRGGWFVDAVTELTARLVTGDAEDRLVAVLAGVGWDAAGGAVRTQIELGHAFDGPGGRWRTSNTGWRPESGHGQWLLRAQTQLSF